MKQPSLKTKLILLVSAVVVTAVASAAGLSIWATARSIRSRYGEQAMGIARALVAMREVQAAYLSDSPSDRLQPLAEEMRRRSGVDVVVFMNMDAVRYSHRVPSQIGKILPLTDDEQRVLHGAEHLTYAFGFSGWTLRAYAPVFADGGPQMGSVLVAYYSATLHDSITREAWPLAGAAALGLLLGTGGAVLLARSIKRTLFDLEPLQIAEALQQRQAILNTVREGIIAIDQSGRTTLANDEAKRLLGWAESDIGRPVEQLLPNTRLTHIMETVRPEYDGQTHRNGRTLLVNRLPILVDGKVIGAIASFRDKTEMQALAEELTGVRQFAEALRAQNHEFINRLHTIAGLIEIGAVDEAVTYIAQTKGKRQQLVSLLLRRISDPAIAGLLLGKLSHAEEQGVRVEVDPDSRLGPLPLHFDRSAVVSVLGNLLQNAVEALRAIPVGRRWVGVSVTDQDGVIQLRVADSGPGIAPEVAEHLLEADVSTKPGRRGLGLALVQELVMAAGGTVAVASEPGIGAAFTVRIPREGGSRVAAG